MMEKSFNNIPESRFDDIEENYKEITYNIQEAAIRAGRNPEDIIFMAVTKTVEPELINHAIRQGIRYIGENKVQEFLSKYEKLDLSGCQAHLIGHLQTNKVNKIIGKVQMIESVDSLHLAQEINLRSKSAGIVTDVLLEVNIGGEESKSGIAPSVLENLIEEISVFDAIKVKGLMTIPPICDKIDKAKIFLYNMQKLFIDISDKKIDNVDMKYLSMGMSSDYCPAIAFGANIVRIGTALFGARIYK